MPKVASTTTTPTKTRTTYAQSPRTPARPLTEAKGRWITKSQAMIDYQLGRTDLDSILPVSDRPNPRDGGRTRIQKFNLCDVEALAQGIKDQPTAQLQTSTASVEASTVEETYQAAPTNLAPRNGKLIMRTTAMKRFGLSPVQMDRIRPVTEVENPHRATGPPMRHYNLVDVEALSKTVRTAAASPSTPKARRTNYTDDYVDYYYNPFDGMGNEEAAFKFELFS